MKRLNLGIILFMILLSIPLVFSQTGNTLIEPNDSSLINPAANISFPSPVYVVRDSVDTTKSRTDDISSH